MTVTAPHTPIRRARWAAIGAAVAVSLGAGSLGIARATSPEGAATYVAITPCRLFDTRSDPAFRIGPHDTLTADAQITVAGWGAQGQCTAPDLPSGTTGLQLNVTAVGATGPTYLTFFPGDGTRPNASSLNPPPGQPPTPNAVTTRLDGAGRFSVYNRNGAVDVVVDVVGYYVDHQHTGDDIVDGSLTGADVADGSLTGADVAAGALSNEHLVDAPGLAARLTTHIPTLDLIGSNSEVGFVRVRVPTDGYVMVTATITWYEGPNTDREKCEITRRGAGPTQYNNFRLDDFGGSSNGNATTTAHRAFPVSTADNAGGPLSTGQDFIVICRETNGSISIAGVYMTAVFVPTFYGMGGPFNG